MLGWKWVVGGGDDLLSRIRNLCNEFFCSRARKAQQLLLKKAQESATEGAVELAVSDNFAARVIHCAIEEGTKDLLNCIFECESSRLALDDKRLRVNELWEKLANDFFNQASWNLELFDRERKGEAGVDFINPYNFVQSTTETFSLKFAPAQTFEAVGMLEGQLNTVLGVLEATAWGPTAGF